MDSLPDDSLYEKSIIGRRVLINHTSTCQIILSRKNMYRKSKNKIFKIGKLASKQFQKKIIYQI
jgi:hypothetical protein